MDYIKIIDWLQAQIDSGHILWAFALIVFILLLHLKDMPSYLDALEHGKKARLKRLASASEYKNLDQKLIDFVENETNYEYFRYVTGFAIGKGFREAILNVQNASNHELPMHLFKRAFYYLHFENNELCIKIGIFDKIGYYFNLVGFYISLLSILSLCVTLLLTVSGNITLFSYASQVGFLVFFTFAAWLFVIDIRSFRAAQKIDQLLGKLKLAQSSANTLPK